MNQTPNYQLSQWEASDQLRRVDANADNAKIDAALAAKATTAALNALAARVTALENKSRFTKLWELTLTTDTSSITIPLTSLDWMKWDKLHLDVQLRTSTQTYLCLNDTNSYKFSLYGESDHFMARITFHVGNTPGRYIHINKAGTWLSTNVLFSNLKKLIITGNLLNIGDQFILWGEE